MGKRFAGSRVECVRRFWVRRTLRYAYGFRTIDPTWIAIGVAWVCRVWICRAVGHADVFHAIDCIWIALVVRTSVEHACVERRYTWGIGHRFRRGGKRCGSDTLCVKRPCQERTCACPCCARVHRSVLDRSLRTTWGYGGTWIACIRSRTSSPTSTRFTRQHDFIHHRHQMYHTCPVIFS